MNEACMPARGFVYRNKPAKRENVSVVTADVVVVVVVLSTSPCFSLKSVLRKASSM